MGKSYRDRKYFEIDSKKKFLKKVNKRQEFVEHENFEEREKKQLINKK
mgnify:CR=1 FL=1